MSRYRSLLSPTQEAVYGTVEKFRQASTSQLRRLHYQGTPGGCEVRCRRHLNRLADLGLIAPLRRPVGGWGGGSGEAVWQLTSSKARSPDMHTLDITEVYVRLKERGPVSYDPEPFSYVQMGHMELRPDAYTKVGNRQFFIEVDRGSEFKSQLSAKMRRYVHAYDLWEEDVFPLCLWVVPDEDRKRFVQSVVKRQHETALFDVVTFDEAVERITK